LLLSETFLENKDANKIEEITTPEELSSFLNLVLIERQLIKDRKFEHIEDVRVVEQLFQDMDMGATGFVSERCVRNSSSLGICVDIYNYYCQNCKRRD
jgi:hypothetical protein